MANVQMNYYNGSSYVVLHPEISADNLPDGIARKQVVEYTGNGASSVTLNLNTNMPRFIMGGNSEIRSIGCFLNSAEYTFGTFMHFSVPSSTTDNLFWYKAFKVEINYSSKQLKFYPKDNDNNKISAIQYTSTGSNVTSINPAFTTLRLYNTNGVGYVFLVIY